jgi:hypothetical protein
MKLTVTMIVLCSASLLCWFDHSETKRTAAAMTGGDPDAGRREIEYYGCASCHEVPGLRAPMDWSAHR